MKLIIRFAVYYGVALLVTGWTYFGVGGLDLVFMEGERGLKLAEATALALLPFVFLFAVVTHIAWGRWD